MLDLDKLNPEQREAATTINGPLLILAGAGTGKTSCMTARAAYMISEGINPEQILMLTFTNKAAREMKERLVGIVGEDYGTKMLACTFHSFCALMLRKYGHVANISPNFTIISPGDDEDIISIVKASDDKTRYKGRGFPPNGKVCDYISMSVNKGLTLEEVMYDTKYSNFVSEVEALAQKASEYRRDHNLLNYDDILVRLIDIFREHQNIAAKIAAVYQYIMIDEYQDTNPLQEQLLFELFKYTQNIAVVGDDMQSLYGFRGADVDNIIHFSEKFPGTKTISLVRNYRSSQEILDLSNNVCLWATEGFPKSLIGTHKSSIKPTAISVNNQFDETDYVVQLIDKLHSDGIPYNQICVVARNSILSAGIEIKLNKAGVLFDKYGGSKYIDLSYVKDILAYIKIMVNPYDEIAWFRVLKLHRGIGDVNARRISEKCRNLGFNALVDKTYAKKSFASGLKDLHDQLDLCDGAELTKMVESFVDFYHNVNKENINDMDTDEGSRTQYHIENDNHRIELMKLIELSHAYKSASSFLDDLLLDNNQLDEKSDSVDRMVISTIHSVKGLEYDAVIILDCIDGIFPNADEEGSREDNEELRCFYVAITRARKYLYIMCPKSAMRFGQGIAGTPSRYLKEAQGLIRTNDHRFFDRYNEKPKSNYWNWY